MPDTPDLRCTQAADGAEHLRVGRGSSLAAAAQEALAWKGVSLLSTALNTDRPHILNRKWGT